MKYTYCTKILGYSIAATFSATRGPGGLAISPQLTLRAVVPNDSPAFSLLKNMNYSNIGDNGQIPDLLNRAEWALYQLSLLFNNGKASPIDVTQDGETLLHVSKVLGPQYGAFLIQEQNAINLTLRNIHVLDFSTKIQATNFLIEGVMEFGADPLQRAHQAG